LKGKTQHGFSIEVESQEQIKNLALNGKGRGVLVEGVLGGLKSLGLVDDAVLVVEGENGTLRLDLTSEEMREMIRKKEVKKIDD
jgi:hypothetical protein